VDRKPASAVCDTDSEDQGSRGNNDVVEVQPSPALFEKVRQRQTLGGRLRRFTELWSLVAGSDRHAVTSGDGKLVQGVSYLHS
jgi:hypothetical protein